MNSGRIWEMKGRSVNCDSKCPFERWRQHLTAIVDIPLYLGGEGTATDRFLSLGLTNEANALVPSSTNHPLSLYIAHARRSCPL